MDATYMTIEYAMNFLEVITPYLLIPIHPAQVTWATLFYNDL